MGKRESKVETYLDEQVVKRGGVTRKYVSPGQAGVADRLVILPDGHVIFVECKTLDGTESGAQERERVRMLALGQDAIVVTSKTDVDIMCVKLDKWGRVC